MDSPAASRTLLADGTPLLLRGVRPDDETALIALHDDLGEQSRYFRFFSMGREAGRSFVHRALVDEGPFGHSIVAELNDRVVAMATYHVLDTPHVADVAFAVADRYRGRGIGTLLLEHLVSHARRRGVSLFQADVLAENTRMIEVFTRVGLQPKIVREGTTLTVDLPLRYDSRYLDALAEREQHADTASLGPVLQPASIAVIGAGRKPDNAGHVILRRLRDGGFPGPLYPVNPNADRVAGITCYPDIAALPETPELAIVCVPAAVVPAVAEACAERGTAALVVISGGLATDTAAAPGTRLREIVTKYRMRLVGPNCLGIAHPAARLDATFAASPCRPGHVGVVTQSGGVGIALIEMLRDAGLGLSTFVSTGDKYDISGNDLLLWWSADEDTRVAMLYVESFGNPRKFSRLARRLGRHKPVVAVRAGASAAAQRAARSHTAATATPAVTRDALYHQAGIVAVDDLRESVDVATLLHQQPLPAGNRVAILSNAGGAGVIAADACSRAGLRLPELSEATTAALAQLLPRGASVANPVDTTAAVRTPEFVRAAQSICAEPGVDAVVVIVAPTAVAALDEAFARIEPAAEHPLIGVLLGQQASVRSVTGPSGRPMPVYADPGAAIHCLGKAAAYARWRERDPGTVPDLTGIDRDRADALITRFLATHPEGGWLEPADVIELSECYRLPALPSTVVTDEADVTAAMRNQDGPVAMKAVVPGMVHRTDRHGVILGIEGPRDARRAFREFVHIFGRDLTGVQIQPMAGPGVEVLVGVTQDAHFGPLVQVGAGGTTTELLQDRAARLLPLTDRDAEEMLRELRMHPLLEGFRGAPPADTAALQDTLMRVARLAEDFPSVTEMDINPLVVGTTGCAAVDLKIRVEPAEHVDPYVRALR